MNTQQNFSQEFRKIGSTQDLEADFPISLAEAVLGGPVTVATPSGNISLQLPKGLSTGARIRLRGKGHQNENQQSGDAFLIIKIVMPQEIDPELEEDIRAWSTRYSYNARPQGQ